VSPVDPAVLLARAYLSRVAEPPAAALAAYVEEVGPLVAARRVRSGATHGPGALPPAVACETAARRETERAEADLALLAARGGRLIVPEDPEWPTLALAGLGYVAGPDGGAGMWSADPPALLARPFRAPASAHRAAGARPPRRRAARTRRGIRGS
jgi:DNA processing protein